MPRILVLEDEPQILNLCKRLLASGGFDLDLAADIAQAAKFLDGGTEYALLVSDLRLPDGHGWDFIRLFREKRPAAKVLVMTGSPNMLTKIPDEERRRMNFVMKPFDVTEFAHMVRQLATA